MTTRHYLFFAAILFLLGLLILSACSTVDRYERGVVEPAVDKIYDETVDRFCKFPIDVQMRAMERGTITIGALIATCPQWRHVRDMMVGHYVNE